MKVTEDVFESLRRWGRHPALVEIGGSCSPVRTSAGQLIEEIQATAVLLRNSGIGDRCPVALVLENSKTYVCTLLALLHIGAIPIPLKLSYRSLELEEIFRNADPRAIVTESYHMPVLGDYARDRLVVTRSGDRLEVTQHARIRIEADAYMEDLASINYTYRGYGYPIGAMISHGQYRHGARVFQEGLHGEPGESMLVVLPLSHIFALIGCLFVPLLYEMTPVLAKTLNPRCLLDAIREHGINHVTAVPEIYRLLVRFQENGRSLPTLKVFTSGGSLLTDEAYGTIREAFDVDLLHGYGLTEFAPASRNVRDRSLPGTVGPVCRGVECRLEGDDGHGEILLRTPTMSAGYYKRPDETREAFRDGWFHTGDLGHFENGHLVFDEEKKKTRKLNGNMVDLKEVEKALLRCGGVERVSVSFGRRGLEAGVGHRRGIIDRKERLAIKRELRGLISEYKIPRVISSLC